MNLQTSCLREHSWLVHHSPASELLGFDLRQVQILFSVSWFLPVVCRSHDWSIGNVLKIPHHLLALSSQHTQSAKVASHLPSLRLLKSPSRLEHLRLYQLEIAYPLGHSTHDPMHLRLKFRTGCQRHLDVGLAWQSCFDYFLWFGRRFRGVSSWLVEEVFRMSWHKGVTLSTVLLEAIVDAQFDGVAFSSRPRLRGYCHQLQGVLFAGTHLDSWLLDAYSHLAG